MCAAPASEQWIRPVEQMRDQMVATRTVMGLPRCLVISDISPTTSAGDQMISDTFIRNRNLFGVT